MGDAVLKNRQKLAEPVKRSHSAVAA